METETRLQRLDGSSVESWAMGETLTQLCREGENGCKWLQVVKLCRRGRERRYPTNLAPANLVPAAAVIREELVLHSQTGRKAFYRG
jgi:hypothetical protein